MALYARLDQLAGDRDGSNTVFVTPGGLAYVDGGNVVFVRGLPRVQGNDDGWTNTDPQNGVVTLNEAPLQDDEVQMLYAVATGDDVSPLTGSIDAIDDIAGSIEEVALAGSIEESAELAGALEAVALTGAIEESGELAGLLVEV